MKRVVIVPVSDVDRFPDLEVIARDGLSLLLSEAPLLAARGTPTIRKKRF